MSRLFLHALFCIFIFSISSSAQEIKTPLFANQKIKQYLREYRQQVSAARMSSVGDTLALGSGIFDDFSKDGIYPSSTLWSDSDAFINADFADNPPTINVATLDGLDKNGDPYSALFTAYGIADHLTSKAIDLNLLPSDSIYLSFFYQPQGNGDTPEPTDSLVLQFFGADTLWHYAWSEKGRNDTAFAQAIINISDPTYLHSGFRFRFLNYATLSGSFDHWNIDYVRLNKNRTYNDTAVNNDGAFIEREHSLLKTFQVMPYSHYKINPAGFTKSSLDVHYHNLTGTTVICNHDLRVFDETQTQIFATGANAFNVDPYAVQINTKTFSFTFPSLLQQYATFYVDNIKTNSDALPVNDTLKEKQELTNYYAYDDGTAESGYGLNVAGGKIAYKFALAKKDTLVAVQMYFNHLGTNVSNKLFQLALWTSLNPEVLQYRMFDQKPFYTDAINGFYTYLLDTPQVVSDSIYIGWIQDANDLLNIGLDVNINSNDKMFYNAAGTWTQSQIPGSWMMRPVFGQLIQQVHEEPAAGFEATVFPNPAADMLHISITEKNPHKYFFELSDYTGRKILTGDRTTVNVSTLSAGLYFLKITQSGSDVTVIKKVMVQR